MVGYKERTHSNQGLDLIKSLETTNMKKIGTEARNSAKGGSRIPKARSTMQGPTMMISKKHTTTTEANFGNDLMGSEFEKQMEEIQGNVRKLYSH